MVFEGPGVGKGEKRVGSLEGLGGRETEGKAVGWFNDVERAFGVDDYEDHAGRQGSHCSLFWCRS